MSTDPLMSAILQDLAAGRIDAAEAARRIDALKASPAEDRSEPDSVTAAPEVPTASSGSDHSVDDSVTDPWAAATDRPQHPTFARETVGADRTVPADDPVGASSSTSATPPPPRGKAANGVERITVRAVGRRVRIVGETSVATLSADGPHVLRRNGSTLEVSSDGEIGPSLDGFSILRGVPRSLEDIRALGLGKELLLRVNPALTVDVEV